MNSIGHWLHRCETILSSFKLKVENDLTRVRWDVQQTPKSRTTAIMKVWFMVQAMRTRWSKTIYAIFHIIAIYDLSIVCKAPLDKPTHEWDFAPVWIMLVASFKYSTDHTEIISISCNLNAILLSLHQCRMKWIPSYLIRNKSRRMGT